MKRKIKLTAKAKNTSTSTVAVTHYGDTRSTGETVTALSQAGSDRRLYQVIRSISERAIVHGFKFSVSTTNETIGFEPMVLSGIYRVLGEDWI
jgi:hypothetical protein